MKHLRNTLYITTQGAYLAKDGETVAVKIEQETKLQIPIHTLDGIVCFGVVSCSPQLMRLCADRNVYISFLSENGHFYARVQGAVSGNVLLRRAQYRWADDREKSSMLAGNFLLGKLINARNVLLRGVRDNSSAVNAEKLKSAADKLAISIEALKNPLSLDSARGIEGEAASVYFGAFDNLITANKEDFYFHMRSRRPPLDNVNALLSFVYTLLAHDVTSALEGVGLDTAVGFLHRERPGRPSLSLDLMEELRPMIADRLVLSMINRRQLKGSDFKKSETGAVMMKDEIRKELITSYQKRKHEEIYHPYFEERISIGLLAHCQARLLSRFIRGDIDGYPPYIWK